MRGASRAPGEMGVAGAATPIERGTVALVGSLDTKGEEYRFARDILHELGARTVVVDTGVLGTPGLDADITALDVAIAGGADLSALREMGDRSAALTAMGRGAARVLHELFIAGRIHGALALGGSGNTTVAATAFRSLPVGVPKVVLTTMLGGDIRDLVGGTDLTLVQSVTDVAGLNRISRLMIANAAAAVAGMLQAPLTSADEERPLVVASMIGLTTTAVTAGRHHLESLGYEVLVFHMTGLGGQAMESLIDSGRVAGVLDLTTSELADEIGGGICSAGPCRLTNAACRGVPQVVAPGGLDMINFGRPSTVPDHYRMWRQHSHTDQVTLVRTDRTMNAALGAIVLERLSGGHSRDETEDETGPGTIVVLPSGGFSAIDRPGQPFYDPEADEAFRKTVRENAGRVGVRVVELDGDLDCPEVGVAAAELLHQLVRSRSTRESGREEMSRG